MPTSDEFRTSATLLAKLADPQDDAAWREFLARYHPLIGRWCGRWGLSAQEREEVTADVLAKLADAMRRFRYDPERGSFRGWLRTVVNHAVSDLLLAWRAKPGARGVGGSDFLVALEQIQDPESVSSLVEELASPLDEKVQIVQQAVACVQRRVAPHTWKAFWLTAMEDQPGEEVAAQLGMSVDAVYMAKTRVNKKLREEIARLETQAAFPDGWTLEQ